MVLKQAVKVFPKSKQSCIYAIYYLEYHKWTDYQIKQGRNPKTIIQALSLANRKINNIPENKSSNLYSSYQQGFANRYRKMKGIPFKSKRELVDDEDIIECRNNASKLNELDIK